MSCQIYEQPTESGLPMFHTSYMASSAMMTAEIKGGMKKMVMFRHLDMNTNMVNQRIEALGFINPFNSKSYHFEKDTVLSAEVKLSIDIFQSYTFQMQIPLNFAIGVDIIRKGLNINWYKEKSTATNIFLINSRSTVKVDTFMKDVGKIK